MRNILLKLPKTNLFLILFYIGWTGLWFSFYFKNTRGLLYGADILLFLILLFFILKDFNFFKKLPKTLLILLSFFLVFLFLAVLYSPYPSASFDAFLLNYFFHISLFFLLIYLINNFELNLNLWKLALIVTLLSNVYYIIFVLLKCHLSISCFILSGMSFMEFSYLNGIWRTAPAYLFSFLIFLGITFSLKSKLRYLFGIASFINLFFIFWLGRRASILGIILGFFLLSLISPNKILRKVSLSFFLILTILITGLIITPYGKALLIRSDKIKILLSGNYEEFPKAGSLGERLYVWPIYMETALKNPFKGTGIGRRVQKRVLKEVNERALKLGHPHNIFLSLWLQAGIQTALVFTLFYFFTLYKALHLYKFCPQNPLYGILFTFFVAYFILSIFGGMEELTRFTPFWIGSGLVWGYAQKLSNKSSSIS